MTVPAARDLTVLIPTRNRPAALAVTLAGLAAQAGPGLTVRISDQSDDAAAYDAPAVQSLLRVLRHRGVTVHTVRHLPARGMAEHRASLLAAAATPYVLFLDDDVWLEPGALARLLEAIGRLGCGFVGFAVQGLSYLDDVRPGEHEAYEEWTGPVEPERVTRDSPAWDRWRLHNAANLVHLAQRLGLAPGEWRAYKVAWIGGCVLYDRAALVDCGAFDFWPEVPSAHAGEDVVAQLAVMERYGGAGVIPSLAVHLELPTTVHERDVECYDAVRARVSPG